MHEPWHAAVPALLPFAERLQNPTLRPSLSCFCEGWIDQKPNLSPGRKEGSIPSSLDGQRFLMTRGDQRKPAPVTELILMPNWFEDLGRQDPVRSPAQKDMHRPFAHNRFSTLITHRRQINAHQKVFA